MTVDISIIFFRTRHVRRYSTCFQIFDFVFYSISFAFSSDNYSFKTVRVGDEGLNRLYLYIYIFVLYIHICAHINNVCQPEGGMEGLEEGKRRGK